MQPPLAESKYFQDPLASRMVAFLPLCSHKTLQGSEELQTDP